MLYKFKKTNLYSIRMQIFNKQRGAIYRSFCYVVKSDIIFWVKLFGVLN
jgi:hypothetical protein